MAMSKKSLVVPVLDSKGLFLTPTGLVAAASIVLFVMIAITVWAVGRGSELDRGMRALIAAYESRRLIAPRLTGGFKAAEFNPDKDGDAGVDTKRLREAETLILNAVAAQGDNPAQLAYRRMQVAAGRGVETQKYLRDIAARWPNSAEAQNDFGVTLFVSDQMEEAIKQFDRAIELDQQMPEAYFNRALCYREIFLLDEARKNFALARQYESNRGWRTEIDARINEMPELVAKSSAAKPEEMFELAYSRGDEAAVKQIVGQQFEKIRAYALLTLSQEYLLAATSRDEARAEQQLSKLKLIGELANETLGDPSLSDLYNTFASLPVDERGPTLDLIRSYADAVSKIQAGKYDDALSFLERIASEFSRRGCELLYAAAWFNKLNLYYANGRFDDALEAIEPLLSLAESKGWRYELGRCLALRGVLYSTRGDITRALISSERAIPVVSALPDLLAKTFQFSGVAYWKVGNLSTSLTYFHRSLDTLLRSGTGPAGFQQYLSDLSYNYLNVADIYRLKGNHHLALLYAKQSVSAAESIGPNQSACEALSLMGLQYAHFEKFEDASASFDASKEVLAGLQANRTNFPSTLLALRRGKVALLQGEMGTALESFTEAVRITSANKDHRDLQIKALGGRAKALARARQPEEAKVDLASAIKMIEDLRVNIASREDKSSFFDTSQEVFDERISLELSLFSNNEAAFEASEQSRARSLLEDLRARKPIPLAEVKAVLSPNQTLISYAVTDERTYIFVIGRDQFEVRSVRLSSENLDQMVKDYLADLKGQADTEIVNQKGRELYQLLFSPVADLIKPGQKICIIPDKAIHYLPLAALVDKQGRFLVQSFSISYAQSASVLASCIKTSREKPPIESESLLAVANPFFDQSRFSDLERLPEAVVESTNSIKFYNADSLILKESEATEANVRARLRNYDVAHLALHSLVDEGSSWLAALVLASPNQLAVEKGDAEGSEQGAAPRAFAAVYNQAAAGNANDGLLYLQEIYNLGLPRTRLVILSACQSGIGQYYKGEGIVSLASPFLAAQVPTVVVSLWKVDSESAARLMADFHYERKRNRLGAGDALRAAQLRMIESGGSYQHPYRWAPFITIGSPD